MCISQEVRTFSQEETQAVLSHPASLPWIRAREGFAQALLQRNSWFLSALRSRFRFLIIVSPPRTGGTYLTKSLYRSMGVEPQGLPAYFGHDGFPHVPLNGSGQDQSLAEFAEWLLMAQHFLPVTRDREGRILVVLKTVKWIWDFSTYAEILGDAAEWIWVDRPLRDILCSINQKAGRDPFWDGPIQPKIQIEHWLLTHWRLHHPSFQGHPLFSQAAESYFSTYKNKLRSIQNAHVVHLEYSSASIGRYLELLNRSHGLQKTSFEKFAEKKYS